MFQKHILLTATEQAEMEAPHETFMQNLLLSVFPDLCMLQLYIYTDNNRMIATLVQQQKLPEQQVRSFRAQKTQIV